MTSSPLQYSTQITLVVQLVQYADTTCNSFNSVHFCTLEVHILEGRPPRLSSAIIGHVHGRYMVSLGLAEPTYLPKRQKLWEDVKISQ